MRKDNYAYFVTTNGIPRDNRPKTLEKRKTLPKLKNSQKGIAKEIKKGNYYHFALPIEEETTLRKIYFSFSFFLGEILL